MAKTRDRWQTMDKGATPLDRLIVHFEAHNKIEAKTAKTVA